MTTETLQGTSPSGVRVLVGAALAALLVTSLLTVAALLVDGPSGAYGAVVGASVVLLVFGLGAFAVHVVAGALPAASLVVALLTYLLQVVTLGLLLSAVSTSASLSARIDERWLAGVVIAGTLVWLIVQIMLAARARIPLYALTTTSGPGGAG